MRGRKPKPSALRALDGGASHRRDDGRMELTLPSGTPAPPTHLTGGARQEWFRIVSYLQQVKGLLSPGDAAAIGIYCSYYDQWQQAEEQLPALRQALDELDREICRRFATNGGRERRTNTGPRARGNGATASKAEMEKKMGRLLNEINTTLGERNKGRKEMRAYLSELGLTPAARARIRVPDGQGELPGLGTADSPFARAQRGASA